MVTISRRFRSVSIAMLALVLSGLSKPAYSNVVLPIQPQIQQTPEWCWATVGQMIFQYYGVADIGYQGDYQCGIVALYGATYNSFTGQWTGPCINDCFACVMGAGQFQTIQGMLYQYPAFANYFTNSNSSRPITSTEYIGPLPPNFVVSELNAGRPIIAAVTPGVIGASGPPAHVTLIVGYVQSPTELDVIVNDPWPYAEFLSVGQPDPYINAGGHFIENGRYQIEINSFAYAFSWSETGYGIAPVPAATQTPPATPTTPPAPKKSSSGGLFGFLGGVSMLEVLTLLVLVSMRKVTTPT